MDRKSALESLPTELLERIFYLLRPTELVCVSRTCTRCYNIANMSRFWKLAAERDKLIVSRHMKSAAQALADEIDQIRTDGGLLDPPDIHKLSYVIGRKIRINIGRSNYKEGLVQHFNPEHVKIGNSDDYLVALETGRLRAWKISGEWISLIGHSQVKIDLQNPLQEVYQILISKHFALICFIFGEVNESRDFQLVQAYDLTNNCQLAWEKSGLLGTQYHALSLVDDRLIKIDKLREVIEVYEVTDAGLVTQLVLEQPRHSFRFNAKSLSADEQYIVVAGHLVPENAPAVSCWDMYSTHRKVLSCERPVCPFRWYKHTAVRDGIVYGLLNRFRLIGWDPVDGTMKFCLDLTDSSPGDDDDAPAWLAVDNQFILTIHQEKDSITVLTSEGTFLGSIRPIMPEWLDEIESSTSVQQVILRGYTVIARLVSRTSNTRYCQLISADLRTFLPSVNNRAIGPIRLMGHISCEHEGDGALHCNVVFNTTKVLDIEPLGVRFYDYLYTGDRFPDRERCQH